jgi:transcriptional regulator with XRE-family HTH domain
VKTQQSADDQLRLGEIIRRQRELAELSMRQVAAMAGISNPYLSQIERGLVVEAIQSDPDLTTSQRRSLVEAYEALRQVTVKHRRGRGAR